MGAVLKMFKRGKGVRILQEQLSRMGYPMNDQPAIFGASTRDAVKDFQKRKGLEATGIVDEALQNLIRESIGVRVDDKPKRKPGGQPEPAAQTNANQLEALTSLLISKGLITQQELDEAINTVPEQKPVRVSQKPLF